MTNGEEYLQGQPEEDLCETSFERGQELGIPESYKISYPHYYEDTVADPISQHQQTIDSGYHGLDQRHADADMTTTNTTTTTSTTEYSELSLTKSRGKTSAIKRYVIDAMINMLLIMKSRSNGEEDAVARIRLREVKKYGGVRFKMDVGQEVDV